jgi:5-methylcytosine-specific restriction endonuclease McrA
METPRSRIKGMLRQIFLRSKERAEAMKRDKYSCCKCGVKKSVKKGFEQKVQVHHKKGIDIWDEIIDMIYDKLLCRGHPEDLETLCPNCHNEITHGEIENVNG